MMPASHTLLKSLRDSHIPTTPTTGYMFLVTLSSRTAAFIARGSARLRFLVALSHALLFIEQPIYSVQRPRLLYLDHPDKRINCLGSRQPGKKARLHANTPVGILSRLGSALSASSKAIRPPVVNSWHSPRRPGRNQRLRTSIVEVTAVSASISQSASYFLTVR
jgi:hypothetical protein